MTVKDCDVKTEWIGRTAVIAVVGDVDMTSAPLMEAAVASCLAEKPTGLVFDLAETQFLGSAGISALVSASKQATDSGAGFGVAADAPATSRILKLLCLGEILNVHPDLAATLASLPD